MRSFKSRALWGSTFLFSVVAALLATCGPPPADLVIINGEVVTLDDSHPEAQAVAVRGDQLVLVGSNEAVQALVGSSTEVVDAEGRLVIPGLIEGHGHFMGVGDAQLQLPLADAANWGEIVAMVQAAVAEAESGELIRGRGWHQAKWDEVPDPVVQGLPTHASLSAVSPDNPVVLTHASGHAALVNARALEMAGIGANTRNPDGGEIVRDRSGNAIGMLRETAQGLLAPVREAATAPDSRRVARLAQEEALSKGITSFHDAGSSFATVDLYKELADAGELDVRLYVMIRSPNEELAEKLDAYRMVGYGDNHLTVRAIKRSIDGALGPHGAWLLEPYTDLRTSVGFNTATVEDVTETARLAAEHGYQLAVHAIGDRANREVLNIYQRTFAGHDMDDPRWRIEHAQHLSAADIPRFAELGIIAAMQGVHATSDAPFVPVRLGDARSKEGAYVWQKLMDDGVVIVNGTDAPVEDVDPIASFYASVSRRSNNGEVFYPDQRMSPMEALKSYTWNPAYGAFEEDLKGSLVQGKLADIVILSKNILTVPEEEIATAQVDVTIVGGEVKYRR